MRIIWLSRKVTNDSGGDAVFDRKLVGELRRNHEVETFNVAKNPLGRRLCRMVTRLLPPDRAGFGTSCDVDTLSMAIVSGKFDAVVISHEHLDYMASGIAAIAKETGTPTFLIHHNVTSSAMKAILGGHRGEAARFFLEAYERRALTPDKVRGLFALSLDDQRLLRQITSRHDIAVVMPGAPPARTLAEGATVARDLVLLGSYDWFPKRWSLRRFVDAWKALASPPGRLYADGGVPPAVMQEMGAHPVAAIELSDSIRFGILTDRFKAGHKLKTAAYLMSNCIVLSFTDVAEDFRFSPYADLFIRQVSCIDDMTPIMDEFTAMPADTVRTLLSAFKADIAERLSWSRQADILVKAVTERVGCLRGCESIANRQ